MLGKGDRMRLLSSLWIDLGGTVGVVLVAGADWIGLTASGGWNTSALHTLSWVLPEFFRWPRGGSAVALVWLGVERNGWAGASHIHVRSVLAGCLGLGGVMVGEGRQGWGCDGSGGPAMVAAVVVLGMDQIVWVGVVLSGLNLRPWVRFWACFLLLHYIFYLIFR
ncbi:hypothetical protein M0R45_015518 [Rubus argutus]|uniref:Uncharacterized protein n=1 Tax=Rubus argutus TaxID=59490 RepID=A0AAW1XQ13_RUBAR